MSTNRDHRPADRRRHAILVALFACLALALTTAALAPAQDLQGQLDEKESQLDSAENQEGVLSTTIERYSGQIDQLTGEVATLRNREAEVQAELDQTEERLAGAREQLNVLRERFARSVKILRKRLVAIYKSDEPDALTVILQSDGFDDLLERYQYLTSIEEQDAALVSRVRSLRDDTRNTVEEVRTARDEIAARKAELERTRMQLEAREADLSAARANKQDALQDTRVDIERLEGDISDIQGDIQAQLQAAQAATPALPSGPVPGGVSSSGFIWPVSGPVTSPFGPRWGRMHEGIDISVPSGTPIHAVADGRVALAAPTGGYGNYTCVDHGGGLASCYAHQSSFSASVGQSVKQGQVIGLSGCTGSCFGDHLHFEVRVNGAAVDPMGYL
jgi:murein DD-endopeptidase MepM/ murein hydrolase activator NlpD